MAKPTQINVGNVTMNNVLPGSGGRPCSTAMVYMSGCISAAASEATKVLVGVVGTSSGKTTIHTAVQLSLPIAEVLAGVRDAVESVAGQAGLLVIKALIDDEVTQLVGNRYAHDADRDVERRCREAPGLVGTIPHDVRFAV